MGILSKFKTLLKSSSIQSREVDGADDVGAPTRPEPAALARAGNTNGDVAAGAARPTSATGLRRGDSARMALPRIDSITTTTQPGSRFETTIITRQGSCLVLQGVKAMKPDSDEEAEEGEEDAPPTPGARPGSAARPRGPASANGMAPPALLTTARSGALGAIATTAASIASPPLSTSNPISPALSFKAGPAAGGGPHPPGQGPVPPAVARVRRPVNRVASLPLLLDGGMPRAPRAFAADDAPVPEHAGPQPQEPEPRPRRPPKRTESLKYLLNLDQYGFNQDVSVQEAREAAAGSAPTPQGSIEDIISADGTSTSILAVSPALPARMRRPHWSIKDYELTKQLHRGYASDVYQARCRVSGEMVALKVYKLAEQGDIQRMQLYREIKLHARLRHSNVVQYYACFLERQRVVLVTEFCTGGDLLRVMYKCGGRLFERQAVNMVLQPFLTALHYLHTQGIVHRDIKPENVLFAEGQVLKLADFGLALDLKEERANTRAGTLDYMAPEVLRCPTKKTPDENKANPQSAHYSTAVDAWAVGVFAYELVVGAPPFKANQMIDTARNIMHASVAFPSSVSDLARDFIGRALHKDSTERLTVLEMLHHPWITMFQRRSSVRIVYTRSNSLMELVPPEATGGGGGGGQQDNSPRGNAAASGGGAASGSGVHGHVRRASGMGFHGNAERDRDLAAQGAARYGGGGGGGGGGGFASGGGNGWVSQAQGYGGGGGGALTPSRHASWRVASPLSADSADASGGGGSRRGSGSGRGPSGAAGVGIAGGGSGRLLAAVAAASGGGSGGLPPVEGRVSGSRARTRMGPQ